MVERNERRLSVSTAVKQADYLRPVGLWKDGRRQYGSHSGLVWESVFSGRFSIYASFSLVDRNKPVQLSQRM